MARKPKYRFMSVREYGTCSAIRRLAPRACESQRGEGVAHLEEIIESLV